MSISRVMKSLREEQGMTQRELGEIVGMSAKRIGAFEQGKAIPTVDVLEKIADALEASILDFIHVQTVHMERELMKRDKFISEFFGG